MSRTPTKKLLHAHGCRRCRTRYEDACTDKAEDGLCTACRGLTPWQLLVDNRRPRECCLHARLATKDEKKTYCLAGRSNWHLCPACKRTHPFKPTRKDVQP